MSINTSELDLSEKPPMRELEKRLGVYGNWIEEVNIGKRSGLSQPLAGAYCWQLGLAQKTHGDVVCYASEDGRAWAIGPRGEVVPFEREVTLKNVGKTLVVKIGRSSTNNSIVVQGDACVSLWHAEIFYSQTRKSFYVMDLGSEDKSEGIWSNGTWVRSVPIDFVKALLSLSTSLPKRSERKAISKKKMEVGEGLIVGRASQDAKEVVILDDFAKGEAVFFIADGHTGEKVPLKKGLEVAEEAISEARDAYLGYSGDIELSIRFAFSEAERVLSHTAHSDAGTTLTMIVKKGKWAYIGWVGDSMPYGVEENNLSIIEKMEPHHWPDRNYHYGSLLSRSLGDRRAKKESKGKMRSNPDIVRVPWRDFLLATDGLVEKLFTGKEIVQFCRQHGKTGAARMLVKEGEKRIKLLTEAYHRGERLVPPDDAAFLLF